MKEVKTTKRLDCPNCGGNDIGTVDQKTMQHFCKGCFHIFADPGPTKAEVEEVIQALAAKPFLTEEEDVELFYARETLKAGFHR